MTYHPMALAVNLYYSYPSPVLIVKANIISLSVKPHVANGASEKIAYISGASIFGGYATVQLWTYYYNTKGH